MYFSIINEMSVSVNRSRITLVVFKAACHANPGAKRKWAESSSYFSK